MLNVTKELTALARKLGYTGKAPDTVAKAINAITASVNNKNDESEGSNGVILIPLTIGNSELVSTKTMGEIKEMFGTSIPVFVVDNSDGTIPEAPLFSYYYATAYFYVEGTGYEIDTIGFNVSGIILYAETDNDYPSGQ